MLARLFCGVFALIGVVPLIAGGLARLDRVQAWVAQRTAQLLHDELGVDASYELELRPWPLTISMENLEIAASDGGTPFLKARTVVARPRIFSLLAGKPDLGAVEIEEADLRAVVKDGALTNLSYQLPEATDDGSETSELPVSAISLTNARIDFSVDGARVRSQQIDVDVAVERLGSERRPLFGSSLLEVSLRSGRTEVDVRHPSPTEGGLDMVDEDVICRLDLRARVAEGVVVRRLRLEGAVDFDPDPGSRPTCQLAEEDWRRVFVELDGGEARFAPDGSIDSVDGRLRARVPAPIAHRFLDLPPLTGWVEVDLDEAHYDTSLRIPNATGTIRGAGIGIDTRMIAHELEARVRIDRDVVVVSDMSVGWAGGTARFASVTIEPFADKAPLIARDVLVSGITLEDMLDDLDAHPHAHVGWALDKTTFATFGGTLDPLDLSGLLVTETRDFGVYDKPTTDPYRQRMMGVDAGTVSGDFRVTPEAIVLANMTVATSRSLIRTTVSLGYDEELGLAVYEGSKIDLQDVSPLVAIPMEGVAQLSLSGGGKFGDPHFEADLKVSSFDFGGFPIGDILQSKVRFVPLELQFSEARVHHGDSTVDVPILALNFDDGDAAVVLDGSIDSRQGGMHLHDFFDMVNLLPEGRASSSALPTKDPLWQRLDGLARGTASLHYVLGGRRDRCRSGRLQVHGRMDLARMSMWDIAFDSGSVDVDWLWEDIAAGDHGLTVDVHSAVLRKGEGTIVTSAAIRPGAKIRGDVIATSIPLSEFAPFRRAFRLAEGEDDDDTLRRVRPEASLSFVASISGELGQLAAEADVDLSPMRIGPDLLPPSRFRLFVEPSGEPARVVRKTHCGNDVLPAFDPRQWASDPATGVFRFEGQLFEGQARFDDLQVTQQRAAMVSGEVQLKELDLGALANLLPNVAFSAAPPRGRLTARVVIDELPVESPALAEVRTFVEDLDVSRGGDHLRVTAMREPLLLSGDALRIPTTPVSLRLGSGLAGRLRVGGTVGELSTRPTLALTADLDPIDLAELGVDIPQIKRAAGIVEASIELDGTLDAPRLGGHVQLERGLLRLQGLPLTLEDIGLDLRIRDGEVRIRRATARAGNTGRLSLSGRMPLSGLSIGGADATLIASDVKLPLAEGVKVTADARLHISYQKPTDQTAKSLPAISGGVTLKHFTYTRPMSFRLDIDQLTGRGRSQVETYKPEDDSFTFDISVAAPQPVRIANNLLDMQLDVRAPGIRVSGTDQRFGARGQLGIEQGSKLFLQGHDFTVRDGNVSFDNPSRIAPRLDVTATTEYRRYAANADPASAAGGDLANGGGTGASGGKWRISMHAYGDTDVPEVRFTSDPPLSQEDIVLLLQVGMTRAELDRNLSGALAQTVGLEALSAVTGLDQAVRKTVPIIDEFRVGTQYSSRTGRPEPSVTFGKRITDDVRATVTTGVGEDREVRSNIEWRLKGGVSVHGSYDNANDISSSVLGNVGAGLRWRLEFE